MPPSVIFPPSLFATHSSTRSLATHRLQNQASAPALGPGFSQLDHDTTSSYPAADGASAPGSSASAAAAFQPLALPDGWRLDTLEDDEYDPMRPTVWQDAVARRERDRAAAAAQSAGSLPKAAGGLPPARAAAPAAAAAAAPGPGRGIDQRPAWMVALDAQGAADAHGMDEAQDVVNSIGQDLLAPPSKPASSVAAAIMQKHGHVAGQGLGKHGSGMTSALEAVAVGHGRGVVHQGAAAGTTAGQPADTTSTVLVIRGWIDSSASADTMRAAEQQVREAGAAYGPVEAVVADAASARVFIQYAVSGAAATALDMLPSVWQHRYGVAMYPEEAFENLEFTAELDQWR